MFQLKTFDSFSETGQTLQSGNQKMLLFDYNRVVLVVKKIQELL
jgi:hypothetical protein